MSGPDRDLKHDKDHKHDNGKPASIQEQIANRLQGLPYDGLIAIVFFTRLPLTLPGTLFERHDRGANSLAQGAPLVGLLVGGLVGGVALAASMLGLPGIISATLAVSMGALLTGGLHEDGLADVADGFGGGRDKTRKLAIMKDSAIGTYGVLALFFIQFFRIAGLAACLALDNGFIIIVSMLAHLLSRCASIALWATLPPARDDGLSASIGQPDQLALIVSISLGALVALVMGALSAMLLTIVLGLLLVVLAFFGLRALCHRQIAGQTGDTIGAVQQICEVAFLMAVLMSAQ